MNKIKQDFRERILTLLRNQEEEKRFRKSREILKQLLNLREFKEARAILFYASFDGEVDTFEMISQALKLGKKIALPRIDKTQRKILPVVIDSLDNDLEQGPYGIKQPRINVDKVLDLKDINMVIVPGVAFDKRNNRLGRGGGYYDRFLTTVPSGIPTVGLAFDFQIVDRLPHLDEHDQAVSHVLVS